MIIEISKYSGGVVASSRKNAQKVIKNESIDFKNKSIFDFGGIKVASHSFIDELIGVYIEEIGKVPDTIGFKNCNNYVEEQIKFVITERLNKKEYA